MEAGRETRRAPPPASSRALELVTEEDRRRARDRLKVAESRRRGKRLRLLALLAGPGLLVMLGENDGPSMLSYAATGTDYGIGFFLPFIVVTFAAAVFVQDMGMRLGAVSHRGFGQLIFQRFGAGWGWVTSGDLVLTNFVTLVSELVAIRVGLSFFGIAPWVGVAGTTALVACTTVSGSYERWEAAALALAAFNLLFVPAALLAHPDPAAVGRALATWRPLPAGSPRVFLLIVASDIGATVTPWMLFFQQGATADKGLTGRDLPQGRVDTIVGGALAALAGCAALVAAAPLYRHHVRVRAQGGAGYAQALRPFIGHVASTLLALGFVEAGALAVVTISASTAYAIGEAVPGGTHSFNAPVSLSRIFHPTNVAVPLLAGLVTLVPGAPLLAIALNANLLATVLMPAALVFLLLLANDREVMGAAVNGRLANVTGVIVTALVALAGGGYAVVAFFRSLR